MADSNIINKCFSLFTSPKDQVSGLSHRKRDQNKKQGGASSHRQTLGNPEVLFFCFLGILLASSMFFGMMEA